MGERIKDDEKSDWLKLVFCGDDTARYCVRQGIAVAREISGRLRPQIPAWLKYVDTLIPTIEGLGEAHRVMSAMSETDLLATMTMLVLLPGEERGLALRRIVLGSKDCVDCGGTREDEALLWYDLHMERCLACKDAHRERMERARDS